MELDRTFLDKASGKDVNRPQLQEMLAFVREGEAVFCHSMDRLGRNVGDLRNLVDTLTERKVSVHFLKESLTFNGENEPMANLMLSVMGAVAEFERDLLRERQREGIALAKTAGVYKGRKRKFTSERADELTRRWPRVRRNGSCSGVWGEPGDGVPVPGLGDPRGWEDEKASTTEQGREVMRVSVDGLDTGSAKSDRWGASRGEERGLISIPLSRSDATMA